MRYEIGARERRQQSCGFKDEGYVTKLPEKEVMAVQFFLAFQPLDLPLHTVFF
jgi:hypothetical protein